MENIAFWQNLWFFLILAIFCVYTILDGFDLGIGIMLPFFYRDKNGPQSLLSFISPVWDGNEVWLITGAASIFAVFPAAYAALLSGFYLPLILTVFFFIFRAVAFGLWYHDPENKFVWEIVIIVSSMLASFAAMTALGNLLSGIPMNPDGSIAGNLQTFFRPLPLAFAVTGLILLCLQGMTYAKLNSRGSLAEKTLKLVGLLSPAAVIFLAVFLALYLSAHPSDLVKTGIWTGAFFSTAALLAIRIYLGKLKGRSLFILSSISIAGLWIVIGSVLYPDIIKSTAPGSGMTIFQASASLSTLKLMAYIAVTSLAIVSAYSLFVYRIFINKKESPKTHNK